MEQDTLDRLALDSAFEQARIGLAEGGMPIGAALMNSEGVVLALGRSLVVQQGDPTAHAETVCIRNAGRRHDWASLTLATTLSPCAMCAGASVLLRLRRIVIGENHTFSGREDWLEDAGIEVRVMDDLRCQSMMERFIATRPELWHEHIGSPRGE
ncbi:MAG TPA: nucleoside deaminase [Phycisphaerales bacterium]|nr:nucleoside deaminase [Phycisphaerales bacterium]